MNGGSWRLDHLMTSRHHLDDIGRALGEQASAPTPPDELTPCPFAGGRLGLPMNRGALAQVAAHRDAVAEQLDALSGPGTVAGAWARCAHLTLRAMTATPPVPEPLAAAFKTFLGFRQVLGALLLTHGDLADVPLCDLGDGKDFVALLEREGWLVGRHQACAGAPDRIARWYERLAHPTAGTISPVPLAEVAAAVIALVAAHQHRARHGAPHEARWLHEDDPLCRSARHRPGLRPQDVVPLLPRSEPLAAGCLVLDGDAPPHDLTEWVEGFVARRWPAGLPPSERTTFGG